MWESRCATSASKKTALFLALLAFASISPVAQARADGFSVSSTFSLDEVFTFPLENGCAYSASVSGILYPVVTGRDAGRKLLPDLDLMATLACPSLPDVSVNGHLSAPNPITPAALEDLLAHRATIAAPDAEDAGRKCTYVPAIHLVGDGLVGRGISYSCKTPSQ